MTMMAAKALFLRQSALELRRGFHTAPVLERLKKVHVWASIDTHEFHKVIKFVKPEQLKPWDPRISCDLKPQEKIDPNWLRFEYRPFADIIESLPEEHRRLFTVGFGHMRDGTKILLQDSLAKTRRHKYDESSLDFKITWATWKIRKYQQKFKDPVFLRNGALRADAKVLVEKRKKWLHNMRHRDYKRFEWIIEVLGIIYKLRPVHTRIERKTSINVLVNMFCNELRDQKMAEYKNELEKEKVPFLKMKLETLQSIRMDEESVGLESSVDDDIRETRKLLLKLEKEHLTIHPAEVLNAAKDEHASITDR